MIVAPDVGTESKPCPLGCDNADVFVLRGTDRLHGLPGEFTVVRCMTCGLMRTDPRPTAETIGSYYPSDYSPYSTSQVKPIRTGTHKQSVFKRTLSKWLRLNTEIVPDLRAGRMLEFGCASGHYLAHMAQKGWQVCGIELDEGAASRARNAGFDVQTTSIERAVPPPEPVDLIVGWMVLEHLHEPQIALRRLRDWTRDGGWLAVSVPNAASLDFRAFKQDGYALQLPTHLYHFTPATLTALLDRTGWKVERIYHQRILGNYFGSIGNWLERRGLLGRLAGFFKRLPDRGGYFNHWLLPASIPLAMLGQTGRMTVWARKTTTR